MAEDLFRDTTMTFGEHIEELRYHLIRALWGLGAALVVCMGFGQYVVKVIIEPVEIQLQVWKEKRMAERSRRYAEEQDRLSMAERDLVRIPTMLDSATLRAIAGRLDPDHPLVQRARPLEDRLHVLEANGPAGAESAEAQELRQQLAILPAPLAIELEADLASFVGRIAKPMTWISGGFSLRTLSAQEAFLVYFKAALGAALVLASPWVFYQIYSFIAVGLYAHERRFVNLTLPFSVILFLAGVGVCYFLVFPLMLRFFLDVNAWMDLEPDIRLNEWVGFSVVLMLVFGAMFQLPLLMLMLERVGILSHEQLADKRRLAILVNFIVAAVVTPTADPTSLLLLAAPMCLLFELGLFLMRYFERRNAFAVESPEGEQEDLF